LPGPWLGASTATDRTWATGAKILRSHVKALRSAMPTACGPMHVRSPAA